MILLKGNFSKLFSVLLIAQIINFCFALILPHYFSPTEFATFGVYMSLLLIATETINLKLDVAVQLPKNDVEAKQIYLHAIAIAFLFSLIWLLVSVILSIVYNKIYVTLFIVVLAYGIYQPLFYWLNRIKNYQFINIIRLILAIVAPIAALILKYYFDFQNALIIGFIIAQLLVSIILILKFKLLKINQYNFKTLQQTLQAYKIFPMYSVPSSFINTLSKNIIIPLIQFLFGSVLAGSYTMATRVLQAPVNMYNTAMGQIYYSEAAHKDTNELKTYTKEVALIGFVLALIPTIILLIFGKSIVVFIFGEQWINAGIITQYLILWYALSIVVQPISFLLDIKKKLAVELKWNTSLLLCRVLAIAIGYYLQDFYVAIVLFVVVSILFNIYLLNYILKLSDE
ncbi:MAG: oligosaccharide flippase family protein [Chitinophagales bacterium]|nr:oligosaccharide flippase family protein [Chitinophagales bacterium]